MYPAALHKIPIQTVDSSLILGEQFSKSNQK